MTRILNEEDAYRLVKNKRMTHEDYVKSGDDDVRYMKQLCAMTGETNKLLADIGKGDEGIANGFNEIMRMQKKIISSILLIMDRMAEKRKKGNFEFTIHRDFDGKIESVTAKEM